MSVTTAPARPFLTRVNGQRVLITGGRFHDAARILKVNPVNILVRLESSNTKVNAHPSFLSDLAEGAPVPSRSHVDSAIPSVRTTTPHQAAGAVVTVKGREGLWVVLVDKVDKINVARLGGDADRYLRAPREYVTPVTPVDWEAAYAVANGS